MPHRLRLIIVSTLVIVLPLVVAGCGSDHGHRSDERARQIEDAKSRGAWSFD